MKDREPFRMGGLLEFWQGSAGEVATFTILTTAPNTLMAEIHNRMRSSSGPRPTPSGSALAPVTSIDCNSLTGAYPENFIEAYPVSKRVKSPANEGIELVQRTTQTV